jgi:hypothetical protein
MNGFWIGSALKRDAMKKSKETFICFYKDLCAVIHAESEEKARKIFNKSLKEYKKQNDSKKV